MQRFHVDGKEGLTRCVKIIMLVFPYVKFGPVEKRLKERLLKLEQQEGRVIKDVLMVEITKFCNLLFDAMLAVNYDC